MASNKDGLALGEAFYWMAEKLTWGYEDVEPDPVEALKLFRQSADLGFSDALIRIGQLHNKGRDGLRSERRYPELPRGGEGRKLRGAGMLGQAIVSTSQLERADASGTVSSRSWRPTPSTPSSWPGEANCSMTTSPPSSSWDLIPSIWKCFDSIGSRSRAITSDCWNTRPLIGLTGWAAR